MAEPFGSPLPGPFTYQAPGQQYYQYQQQPGWNAYGSAQAPGRPSGSLHDEPPILEELGIQIGPILRKSKNVLLAKVGDESLRDIDMGGPLIFAASLAALHLLHGKLHFGVILGWSAVSCTFFWFIIHQLAGLGSESEKECIDLYNCSACLGYCLLPMVVMNVAAVFLPHASSISMVLLGLASVYCALLAAKLVVKRARFMEGQLTTIAYPAFLYYVTLALISLY